jgi:hypothetical protein
MGNRRGIANLTTQLLVAAVVVLVCLVICQGIYSPRARLILLSEFFADTLAGSAGWIIGCVGFLAAFSWFTALDRTKPPGTLDQYLREFVVRLAVCVSLPSLLAFAGLVFIRHAPSGVWLLLTSAWGIAKAAESVFNRSALDPDDDPLAGFRTGPPGEK